MSNDKTTPKFAVVADASLPEGTAEMRGTDGSVVSIENLSRSPYMSKGSIDFDESKLTFQSHMYVDAWRKQAGFASRIPLGPPGERYVAWTDLTVVEVFDWRVYREVVPGMRFYHLPQAAICLPLDIEVIADMHHKLQVGDPEMLAKFNDAVDHGTSVHPSVEVDVVLSLVPVP
ncbi:MAG: hypothetical protein O7G84_00870 [Gammaproteobacteria bacterium]|nr:hypothetical protein [Gammaproteobacteria bacterium]